MAKSKSGGKSPPGLKALEKAVHKATLAVRAATKDLDEQGLESLTPDERQHSTGKLRDQEEAALVAILDAIDVQPGLFAALAPHDHGKDDKVVETGPARAAIARRLILAPLLKEIGELLTRVSDDVMASGARAKEVTVPAYAIIKANAAMAPAVRKAAAPAIGFYASKAKKAAPRAKKAAKPPAG